MFCEFMLNSRGIFRKIIGLGNNGGNISGHEWVKRKLHLKLGMLAAKQSERLDHCLS